MTSSYISEGNDRKIRDNEAQIDDLKREISSANEARVNIDATIQTLQSEEATAGNLKTNIASNLNYREQLRAISKVQEELDGIDVEAAAKARREFETKYAAKVEEENTVHSKVCHLRAARGWTVGWTLMLFFVPAVAIEERRISADGRE